MKSFAAIPFIFLVVLLLLLCCMGCTTQRKAINYFNTHELVAATYCAAKFPTTDSIVTRIDTIVKANNKDYSKTIDSLTSAIEAISGEAKADSIKASLSHKDCENVVQKLAQTNNSLRRQIAALKADYKPCLPDTIIKTTDHYITNKAREKELEIRLADMSTEKEMYQGRYQFWLKYGIISMALLAILIVLIIFRSRLPFKLF